VNNEKVLPEDGVAKALREDTIPMEPSAISILIDQEVPEIIIFDFFVAPSLEQESLIVNGPARPEYRLLKEV
jgi:hypothetical protein